MKSSTVAAIIVNYRTPELTARCLDALWAERVHVPGLRAVVVDGGSGDRSPQELSALLSEPRFSNWTSFLPLDVNGGFGWANNQAILRLLGGSEGPDYLYLINPDARPLPGAVRRLVEELDSHPEAGACGSRLYDENRRLVGAAFDFPTPLREFLRGARTAALSRLFRQRDPWVCDRSCEVDWVTGASLMLRSAALRDTGLFDDGFFLYYEEVELMWRLKCKGWSARHVPQSEVIHIGGAATGLDANPNQALRRYPSYWHQSRRRFFVMTRGSAAALVAASLWILGHGLWRLRAVLTHRRDLVPFELRDHLRFALVPRRGDRSHNAPTVGSATDQLPAWMSHAE